MNSVKKSTIDVQNTKKINKEFKVGDELLKDLNTAVTVYGSARTKRGTKSYEQGVELGEKLALAGFDIITGGGPGAMQAVNEGAYKVPEIKSVGLGIELPFETSLNQYVNLGYTFKYFFVRKVMMVKYADAFVALPGGIGTLEEVFETLTLIQTSKTTNSKVYLIGEHYWRGLFDWLENSVYDSEFINKEDLDNIILTDDIDMIVEDLKLKHF